MGLASFFVIFTVQSRIKNKALPKKGKNEEVKRKSKCEHIV